ncbi:MAG: FecR domain-containing protein [Candidatus Aminicenantes bacterium]|nr:FecR domain-containing protein [Candidatus Aminicenantes bacterium]
MKSGGFKKVVLGMVFLVASSGLWAADHYKVLNGPKNYYYGHVSFIEATPAGTDPVVLREGQSVPEQAVLNLPVGPGDIVRTSADRRCEIQFDTGTVVRLDLNTVLGIETILARSLSSLEQISNLALDMGRIYVMYREYDGREIFQVLTPNAAVKMKHNAVALVTVAPDGSTETQVKYGKAQMRFGASESLLDDQTVRKGERLIVQKDSQFQIAPAIEDTAFELWNKEVNAHFGDLHEGLTALPKPIQKLPAAVFYFAQTYGSMYGEWLWDDMYGYVWRPFIDNGMYPWGWQPYYYGQWAMSGGQMFWVPQESWGWIPYHLGIWQWDKKHGWIWLPGSMFAPAWATWDFYFGYACWRPWSLYDWMGGAYSYYGSGFNYLDGAWGYNWPFGRSDIPWRPAMNIVRKDQLKQPGAAAFPVPSELKGALKKVTAAYDSGDARIRDSAIEVPRHLVFVAKGDLKSPAVNEKAMTWKDVPKTGAPPAKESGALRRPVDPQREAIRTFRGLETPLVSPQKRQDSAAKPIEGGNFVAIPLAPVGIWEPVNRDDGPRLEWNTGKPAAGARTGHGPAGRDAGPAVRFRDWNPDIKIARELGVHIEYSSQKNEIRCPELGISSQDRERGSGIVPHMTSQGVTYGPSGSSGSVGSGSSGASVTESNSGRSSSSSNDKGGQAKESGKIKN